MGAEYERKFKATRQCLEAVDAAFPGPFQVIQMQTTYYDTPTGQLNKLRCTLRSRLENGVCVCTLKTPEKDGVRGEWEVESSSIEAAASVLCKLSGWEALSFLPGSPLNAVCGARFTRTAKQLTMPEFTAELALDTGVLTGAGKEIDLCEVEVELKSGSRAAFDAFADVLAQRFRLEIQPQSKFRRAYLLSQGE